MGDAAETILYRVNALVNKHFSHLKLQHQQDMFISATTNQRGDLVIEPFGAKPHNCKFCQIVCADYRVRYG